MEITGLSITENLIGTKVIYIPTHAENDVRHKDCERGVISSWNDTCVFVKYGGSGTAQATSSANLIFDFGD